MSLHEPEGTDCLAKGGDFSGKFFHTRLDRPSQSNVLSEVVSAPLVDHWICKAPVVGSIPSTCSNQLAGWHRRRRKIFFHFFTAHDESTESTGTP